VCLIKRSQPWDVKSLRLRKSWAFTLFERVGRSLKITQTGADLADHVRAMADAAGCMTLMASGQSQAIEGMVRIAASELFAAHLLPPIVAKLRSIAPKIEVDIVTAKTVSDLLQREGDIAVCAPNSQA